MTQPSISTPKFEPSKSDLTKLAVVVVVAIVGLVAFFFARQVLAPLDSFMTGQTCERHGREVLSRQLVEHEASNRFALTNRTQGQCVFGPVVEFDDEGEVVLPAAAETEAEADSSVDGAGAEETPEPVADLEVSLADFDKGGSYQAMKWIFVLLQFGAASTAIRFVADPLLDLLVRRK